MTKAEKIERKKVLTDMNDFLLEYASKKLGNSETLAKQVYEAGKDDLTGLDKLFDDDGFGRKEQFIAVGMGILRDTTHDDPDQAELDGEKLAKEAMAYLGRHIDELQYWKDN